MCQLSHRGCLAITLLILAFVLFLCGLIAAKADDCGLIRDHDRRQFCYGASQHRESDCNLIRDDDDRRFCRAVANRGR